MPFIGIVTNQKNEDYITKGLSNVFLEENVIFITEQNIENMKNIKFETIVINKEIKKQSSLKVIISKAKYIILNADLNIDLGVLENLNLIVISYGFNNKATLTISSVTENNIILCLQRTIKNIFENKYEPQEFEVKNHESIETYVIICIQIILLMYQKTDVLIS